MYPLPLNSAEIYLKLRNRAANVLTEKLLLCNFHRTRQPFQANFLYSRLTLLLQEIKLKSNSGLILRVKISGEEVRLNRFALGSYLFLEYNIPHMLLNVNSFLLKSYTYFVQLFR